MTNDPVCVRRSATTEEADVIAAWLDDQGIKATVMGHDSFGHQAFGVTDPEGVGVFVADEAAAERAVELLTEHDKVTTKGSDTGGGGTVSFKCEGCGGAATFPVALKGTTQECPHCGAYVDVPESQHPA